MKIFNKFAFAIVAPLAAVVNAQTPSACLALAQAIPSCGVACITSAAAKINCGALDFNCQCSSANNAQIASLAQGCVIASCTPIAQALSVQAAASSVCACAATASPNAGAGASTTAAASGSTSAAAGLGGSSAATTAASGMGSMASASTPAATSPASSGASSGGTSIGPATTAPLSLAGADALAIGSLGGVAAAVLGVVAYL